MALARRSQGAAQQDEPFGALDAKQGLRVRLRQLHDEVHRHHRAGCTIRPRRSTSPTRIAVLSTRGRVEQVGTPTEVYDSTANAGSAASFPGHGVLVGTESRAPCMTFALAATRWRRRRRDGTGFTGVRKGNPSTASSISLGFEVRVELTSATAGAPFTAQICSDAGVGYQRPAEIGLCAGLSSADRRACAGCARRRCWPTLPSRRVRADVRCSVLIGCVGAAAQPFARGGHRRRARPVVSPRPRSASSARISDAISRELSRSPPAGLSGSMRAAVVIRAGAPTAAARGHHARQPPVQRGLTGARQRPATHHRDDHQ